MTPVYKLSANSVKNGRTVYGSMLAGNTAYVIPSAFESIATYTVPTGQQYGSIEFANIPQTYTHLQIRGIGRSGRNNLDDGISVRFNSVSTGGFYSSGYVRGNGSNVTPNDYRLTSSNEMTVGDITSANSLTNSMGMFIFDIYDYTNTSKTKTLLHYGGYCNASAGDVEISSGSWRNTSAITTILLFSNNNYQQYTQMALYGIKSA